ncbi:MAG: cobalamin-dependent protein [Gammaproteobacteria bacterium]
MNPDRIRVLTAVPLCDGHDSPIHTINRELVRHGVEVVYLGYHRSARCIACAAVQEDVDAVGISSYNGGHVEFFAEVLECLKSKGAGDIRVFGGGGGTITQVDAEAMYAAGVDRLFFAGTSLSEIIEQILHRYAKGGKEALVTNPRTIDTERYLSKILTKTITKIMDTATVAELENTFRSKHPLSIGIAGPGGVGKTTLIDELVLRFLAAHPDSRIAILLNDPTLAGGGALLADRASMVYALDQRVFIRSLASAAGPNGLCASTDAAAHLLKVWDRGGLRFDLILVETVGLGQQDMPFDYGLVDRSVMVMGPVYGAPLQLQKIAMLDLADMVVINKSDLPTARIAANELRQRLDQQRRQTLIATVAKRHADPGVDELFRRLVHGQ